VSAFLTAYYLRFSAQWFLPAAFVYPLRPYFFITLGISLFWLLLLGVGALYSLRKKKNLLASFGKIFFGVSTGVAIFIIVLFLIKESFFSRLLIVYLWFFAIVYLSIARSFFSYLEGWLHTVGCGIERVFILGNSKVGQVLVDYFKSNRQLGLRVVAQTAREDFVLSSLRPGQFDELIIIEELPPSILNELIRFSEENNIRLRYIPSLTTLYTTNVDFDFLAGYPLLTLKPTPLEGWNRIIKRVFDFIISAILLIILAPFMWAIALAVRLNSKGPALFKQRRPGQFGRPFTFYKFRSMYTHLSTGKEYGGKEAEDFRNRLKAKNEAPGFLFKIKNDPRVTKVGRFLRRTSLDELPQLFNVIDGEMSLVGPRPALFDEVKKYEPRHRRRLLVKPGITGLWQVSGRVETSFEDYIRMDTYYLEHWSLLLDLKIIFRTILAVLKKKGAY